MPMDSIGENLSQVAEQTKSMLHLEEITKYLTIGNAIKVLISVLSILIFYIVYRIIKGLVKNKASLRFERHTTAIINKAISYAFYILMGMYILSLFGVNLNAVWGAAGVAGLAISFASQSAASNFISGLFVLGEKSLKIGDFISVGDTSGNVENVGLLSIMVKTLDNQVVRIPNSTIINSNLMNYSSFPTRRLVFEIPISYESDMTKAIEAALKVPPLCPTVLKEPSPAVFYDGFGSAIKLNLAVWFKSEDLIQTKNDVYTNIVKVCNQENIVIPYTRLDVKIIGNES